MFKDFSTYRFRGEDSMYDSHRDKRKSCDYVFVDELKISILGTTISEPFSRPPAWTFQAYP